MLLIEARGRGGFVVKTRQVDVGNACHAAGLRLVVELQGVEGFGHGRTAHKSKDNECFHL